MKYFRHILMDHGIFFKIFDEPQNIFLRSVFIILFFKLRGWSTKYPNQTSRRFKKDKTWLNKSHPLSRYKANSGKNNEKKCQIHFDPETSVFVLSNWHKIQLCDKFSSVIFICLILFSQLWFGQIGCMILIKEYVSLTTAAMKMGERQF